MAIYQNNIEYYNTGNSTWTLITDSGDFASFTTGTLIRREGIVYIKNALGAWELYAHTSILQTKITDVYTKSELYTSGALNDVYYTKGQVDGLIAGGVADALTETTAFSGNGITGTYNTLSIDGSLHNHDGQYYTETEIDGLFANYDDYSHWTVGNGSTTANVTSAETVSFIQGSGITVSFSAGAQSFTFANAAPNVPTAITATANTSSITLSTDGNSATIPLANTSTGKAGLITSTQLSKLNGLATGADNYSKWVVSNGTTSANVDSNETVQILGGSSISVSINASTRALTINNSAPNQGTNITTTHNTTTVGVNSSDGSNGTINAATTGAAGVMTNAMVTKLNSIASSANNYSHPTFNGDDFSLDSGALTGATVISDIDINVTTDTNGHVTDANGTVATRTLTPANIGAIAQGGTVTSTLTVNDNVSLRFGTSGGEGSLWSNGTATYWDMGADKDLYIRDATTTRFLFDSSGGHFHADGNITAYSASVGSDRKLKENIVTIPNAIDKVMTLEGVTFDWKRDGQCDAGIIAQDVQAVLPEAVKEQTTLSTDETYLSVNYNAVIGLLVESIKDLKKEIEELKAR